MYGEAIRWCGTLDEVLQNTKGKPQELCVWRGTSAGRRELIVFVHGYARTPADYRGLMDALQQHSQAADGTSDVYAFAYDADPLSCEAPEDIVTDLVRKLNRLAAHYQQLHIVGHSFGCLILRDAVLQALAVQQQTGSNAASSLEVAGGFAGKIGQGATRLTLLAGTNRGFRPTKFRHRLTMQFLHRWFWLVLLTVIFGGWCRASFSVGPAIAASVEQAAAAVNPDTTAPVIPVQTAADLPSVWWGKFGLWMGAVLVLTAYVVAIWSAWMFSKEAVRKWELYALIALLPLWATWGLLEGLAGPGSSSVVFGWLMVVLTPLVVCIVARKFGLRTSIIAPQVVAAWLLSTYMVHLPASPLRHDYPAMESLVPVTPQVLLPLTILFLFPLLLHPIPTHLLIEHSLHGSAWITGIRLNWLETFAPGQTADPPPIVHLYGAEDSLVAEDDHRELNLGEFLQVEIPGAKHSYFQMTPRKNANGTLNQNDMECYKDVQVAIAAAAAPDWQRRLAQLNARPQQSLTVKPQTSRVGALLQQRFSAEDRPEAPASGVAMNVVSPSDVASPLHKFRVLQAPDSSSLSVPMYAASGMSAIPLKARPVVVFLIHGIRDYGEWQEGLAARIREIADELGIPLADVVAVRYGYFSAFQFLFGDERLRATRSFLDLYAQTKATHPIAECHVVAHSNGTFVVGMALLHHGFLRLKNLYLAGSVLCRQFPWPNFHGSSPVLRCGRIHGAIHSDRAAWDWPVGNLCLFLGAIGRLPMIGPLFSLQYVGTGGVDGFTRRWVHDEEFLTERRYLPGDHGEALRPVHHESIARFLLDEERDPITNQTSPMIPQPYPGSLQFQDMIVRRIVLCLVIVFALVAVGGLFAALIFLAPPGCPVWPVLVSALLTLFVVRATMSV